MASLANDGGLRRILICTPDGKRPAIRLGRIPLAQARSILVHIEKLQAARLDGSAPDAQTSMWLAGIDDKLRARLVTLGLAAPKAKAQSVTLGELVERFKDRPRWRSVKPGTLHGYHFGFRHILAYFDADRPVESITEAECEDFRGYLTEPKPGGAGLAAASANRLCDTAAMLFRYAVRLRLLPFNPFDDVRRGILASQRTAFVDDATSRLVLDAMKDSQWRLLFALSRWGGLRVPSEPRELRWGHIDWERNRFTVTSPKTEHHEGHGSRVVPIFPELLPLLEERFAEAGEGEELVLPFMRGLNNSAFRSQLDRTVRKLGLDRWPRIFHNMRSTRQTELEEIFPTHVVCKWLGNSVRVAAKHYLQVTDEHFEKAAQNAAQHTTELPGNKGKAKGDCTAIPRSSAQYPR